MTWQAVARKDFRDAIRSRTLWFVAGLFVALPTMIAVALAVLSQASGRSAAADLLSLVGAPMGWFVPIVAILVGYGAIAGERESGSIKLLLSLPHQRRDVLLGKLVGRTLVVASAVVAGFGTAAMVGLLLFGTMAPVVLLSYTGLTVAFTAAYVSIAVCCSAVTGSSSRAAAGAVGAFALFTFVWRGIPRAVYFALEGSIAPRPGEEPTWYHLLSRLSPNNAYDGAVTALTPDSGLAAIGGPSGVVGSWWVAVLILAAWTVLPALVGYRQFAKADL